MKLQALSTLTALMLTGALGLAQAQTSSSTTTTTDPATAPSTTTTSPSQGAALSSKDAAHALEEAKKACKSEATKQAQQDCMKKAQDDYKAAKASSSSTPATPKQ